MPTLILIRPDGHIAYRGDAADISDLKRYLDRLFVRGAGLQPGRVASPRERLAGKRERSRKEQPMGIATKTIQVLLGLAFLAAGGQKLAGTDKMVNDFARFRYPHWFRVVTGAIEVGGAVGMLLGLARPALAPLAGLTLAATMGGALVTQARLGDPVKQMAPPAALLALAVAVAVLRRRSSRGAVGLAAGR